MCHYSLDNSNAKCLKGSSVDMGIWELSDFSALIHAKWISPRAWFLKCLQSTPPLPTERLLNCPYGTCLQPVPPYRTIGQCIYCISYETVWCVCFGVTAHVTIHELLFKQMSDLGPLLGNVCAGILSSTCVEFSCHSTHFFCCNPLKNRSKPRSAPYVYRN